MPLIVEKVAVDVKIGNSVQKGCESAPNVAYGLLGSVLVFDQSKSNEVVPILSETDSRRNGNLCLPQQEFREFNRAHGFGASGNFRPDEHCPFRLFDVPPGPVHAIDQAIASFLVHEPDLFDALLGTVQSLDRGDLDGLENSIIEVALDPGKRMNDIAVADGKANAPAGHVVAF